VTAKLIASEQHALAVYAAGDAVVPVVDGWVQVSLAAARIPEDGEARATLETVQRSVGDWRAAGVASAWFFLRKAPGLKVRMRLRDVSGDAVAAIAREVADWRFAWCAGVAFDSVFGQRELLAAVPEDVSAEILSASADAFVAALGDAGPGTLEDWAAFVASFLSGTLGDEWIAWEAAGRFSLMRDRAFGGDTVVAPPRGPERLTDALAQVPFDPPPGYLASTAFLQTLNYIFNQWAVDGPAQAAILTGARALLRPDVAGDEIAP